MNSAMAQRQEVPDRLARPVHFVRSDDDFLGTVPAVREIDTQKRNTRRGVNSQVVGIHGFGENQAVDPLLMSWAIACWIS